MIDGRIATKKDYRKNRFVQIGFWLLVIVANKHPNVYAAVCADPSTAVKARTINNANVLTMRGTVTAPSQGSEIVDAFLATEFKSGWGAEIQAFLDHSVGENQRIESQEFTDPKPNRGKHDRRASGSHGD